MVREHFLILFHCPPSQFQNLILHGSPVCGGTGKGAAALLRGTHSCSRADKQRYSTRALCLCFTSTRIACHIYCPEMTEVQSKKTGSCTQGHIKDPSASPFTLTHLLSRTALYPFPSRSRRPCRRILTSRSSAEIQFSSQAPEFLLSQLQITRTPKTVVCLSSTWICTSRRTVTCRWRMGETGSLVIPRL